MTGLRITASRLAALALLVGLVGCASHGRKPAVAKLTPDELWSHNEKAADLIADGKIEPAEKLLLRVLESDVTFGPAHNNLGLIRYQQRKYYEAAWQFDYAARLMPHQPEPRNNLGMVFERVGRLDDAVLRFEQAREIQPDNPQFIGNLARARARRGDTDRGMADLLREVVEKDDRTDWRDWASERLVKLDVRRESPDPAAVEVPESGIR